MPARFVGIDMSEQELVVAVLPEGFVETVPNAVEKVRELSAGLVSLSLAFGGLRGHWRPGTSVSSDLLCSRPSGNPG